MEYNDEFSTRGLPEAAFLYVSQKKLIRIQQCEDHFVFVFNDPQICRRILDAFLRREATVEPRAYSDALRYLKDRLWAAKRGEA